MELQGKRALITGGSRGIGRTICIKLAQAGVHVTFTYRDYEAARVTEREVAAAGGSCTAVYASMQDREAVSRVVRQAAGEGGTLDILVCNAGINPELPEEGPVDPIWDEVIDVNLSAAYRYAREAVRHMDGAGRILFIGSSAALQGTAEPHYAASKAGLLGLARAMARSLAERGITVNVLSPGFVDTEFHGPPPYGDIVKHQASRLIPLRRLARPEEVADAALSILTNAYMTGANILLTGGAVMG